MAADDVTLFFKQEKSDLIHTKELFVKPTGFRDEPDDSEKRVYLIHGQENSGKLFTAIRFALLISKYTDRTKDDAEFSIPIYVYANGRDTLHNLNNIIRSPHFTSNSGIYIIPDALERGLSIHDELSAYNEPTYRKGLKSKNNYLLLTITEPKPSVGSSIIQGIPDSYGKISTDGVDLTKVIDNHLNFYFKPNENSDSKILKFFKKDENGKPSPLWEKLNDIKLTPDQINTLFKELDKRPVDTPEKLLEYAKSIANRDTSDIRRWFRGLDMNSRSFAMLAAPLAENDSSLRLNIAEDLYYSFVQKVRQKPGLDGAAVFRDPRRIAVDDLVDRAGLGVTNGLIHFESPLVRDHILKNEIPNYHGLLWTLAEVLIDQIEPPERPAHNPSLMSYMDNPDTPLLTHQTFETLAELIGRIGIHRENRLAELLNGLMRSGNYNVQAMTGILLKPLARDPEYHDFVLKTLETWGKQPAPSKSDTSSAPKGYDLYAYISATEAIKAVYPDLVRVGEADATKRLKNLILQMAEVSQTFVPYIKTYEENLKKNLEQTIARIRKEQGEKSITDGQVAAAWDDLNSEVLQRIVNASEESAIFLLTLINDLAETHPNEMAGIVEAWLARGLGGDQDDMVDTDELVIDSLLSTGDESAADKVKKRVQRDSQKRNERRAIDSMAWHMGMLASIILFSRIENKPTTDESIKDQPTADVAIANTENADGTDQPDPTDDEKPSEMPPEEPENIETPPVVDAAPPEKIGKPQVIEGTQPEIPDAVGETLKASIAKDKEQPNDSKSSEPPPPQKDPNQNLLSIINGAFPLLKLLPKLVQSDRLAFSPTSYLNNLPRADELLDHYADDKKLFRYDTLFDILGKSPLKEAFSAIKKWYEILTENGKSTDKTGEEEWRNALYPVLLKVFNQATQGQRASLRQLLFSEGWVDSPYPTVHILAHTLIARSYVLDGQILDLPANRYGIVLMDSSGRQNSKRYYKGVYRILQQLAIHTPIRLYRMGSTSIVRTIGDQDSKDILFQKRDLNPRRTYSRLLMPFFEADADGNTLLNPAQTHFVLVLTPLVQVLPDLDKHLSSDILDLLDVAELLRKTATVVDENDKQIADGHGFYSDKEREAARQRIAAVEPSAPWEWAGKLVLVSPNREAVKRALRDKRLLVFNVDKKEQDLTDEFEQNIPIIYVNDSALDGDTDAIATILARRIILSLHELKDKEWDANLKNIWETDLVEFQIRSDFKLDIAGSYQAQLEVWVDLLDDMTKARHPGDITLTIVWVLLRLARIDLDKTITLIEDWLDSDNPRQNVMGLAATKAFFTFYNLKPGFLKNADDFEPLLRLLPAFTATEQGQDASEFLQLFDMLLVWVRDESWVRVLKISENAKRLSDAVRKIKAPQNSTPLRRLITLHEAIVILGRTAAAAQLDWWRYCEWLDKVANTVESASLAPKADVLSAIAQTYAVSDTLNETMLTTLVHLRQEFNIESGIMSLLSDFNAEIRELGTRGTEAMEAMLGNFSNIANAIRLDVQGVSAQDEPMRSLKDGKRYGIILMDGSSSTLRRYSDMRIMVIQFIALFRRRMKQQTHCNTNDFVLTIHRIGRNEHIYDSEAKPSAPTSDLLRLPAGTPNFTSLISPILERYKNVEEVAFVIVITNDEILDLIDWRDEVKWLERMFFYSRRIYDWQRNIFPETNDMRLRRVSAQIEELTDRMIEFLGC